MLGDVRKPYYDTDKEDNEERVSKDIEWED